MLVVREHFVRLCALVVEGFHALVHFSNFLVLVDKVALVAAQLEGNLVDFL